MSIQKNKLKQNEKLNNQLDVNKVIIDQITKMELKKQGKRIKNLHTMQKVDFISLIQDRECKDLETLRKIITADFDKREKQNSRNLNSGKKEDQVEEKTFATPKKSLSKWAKDVRDIENDLQDTRNNLNQVQNHLDKSNLEIRKVKMDNVARRDENKLSIKKNNGPRINEPSYFSSSSINQSTAASSTFQSLKNVHNSSVQRKSLIRPSINAPKGVDFISLNKQIVSQKKRNSFVTRHSIIAKGQSELKNVSLKKNSLKNLINGSSMPVSKDNNINMKNLNSDFDNVNCSKMSNSQYKQSVKPNNIANKKLNDALKFRYSMQAKESLKKSLKSSIKESSSNSSNSEAKKSLFNLSMKHSRNSQQRSSSFETPVQKNNMVNMNEIDSGYVQSTSKLKDTTPEQFKEFKKSNKNLGYDTSLIDEKKLIKRKKITKDNKVVIIKKKNDNMIWK